MAWIQRFTDNFNRANQSLNTGDWVGGSITCKILNQKVTGSASPQISMSYCYGATLKPKQYVEADVESAFAFAAYAGVILRCPGGSERGYMFIWSFSTGQLAIIRFTNRATLSALDGGPSTWPHPLGTSGSGRIRAEADGQLFSLYWGGILIGSQTDTLYATGQAGIINSGQTDLCSVDNFAMGDWVDDTRRSRRHRGGELWGIVPEVANYLG